MARVLHTLSLLSHGPHKIQVIKTLRHHFPELGLADAKQVAEGTPVDLLETAEETLAREIHDDLVEVGAACRLRAVERWTSIDPTDHRAQQIEQASRCGTTLLLSRSQANAEPIEHQFADEATARAALQKWADEQQRSGRLVLDDELVLPSKLGARHPSLERSLLDAPDDEEVLQVYSDWLQGENDPRGELISLQLQHFKRPDDPELARQGQALLHQHALRLLGELRHHQDVLDFTWRHGFLRKVTFRDNENDALRFNCVKLVANLLSLPTALLLHEVEIERKPAALIRALANQGVPGRLRSLVLGRADDLTWWIDGGHLPPLYEAIPQLEELRLRARVSTFGRIELPKLRVFAYEPRVPIAEQPLAEIRRARWPKLERLELSFSHVDADAGSLLTDGVVRKLEQLCHLALKQTASTDALVERLVRSQLAPRLRSLDLSQGTLTERGAQLLVKHRARFASLERLSLLGNEDYMAKQRAALAETFSGVLEIDWQADRTSQ